MPPSLTEAAKDAPTHNPTAEEVALYMPLVRAIVAGFVRKLPSNVLREDLIAAGTIGLFDALRKGGHDQCGTFEWYARMRIRGAILDELRAQDWLSRSERRKAGAEDAVPTAFVGFDDLPERALGRLSDAGGSPLDILEANRDKRTLATAVAALPERERMIVKLHYMDDVQLTTIAEKLHVSLPRASQLRARAIGRLRSILVEGDAALARGAA